MSDTHTYTHSICLARGHPEHPFHCPRTACPPAPQTSSQFEEDRTLPLPGVLSGGVLCLVGGLQEGLTRIVPILVYAPPKRVRSYKNLTVLPLRAVPWSAGGQGGLQPRGSPSALELDQARMALCLPQCMAGRRILQGQDHHFINSLTHDKFLI